MAIKVLMFGWEFPPHISGGLGTACYGLTKGLAINGVNVTFVMPKASGDEDTSYVKIVNGSDVEVDLQSSDFFQRTGQTSYIQVNSKLIPYVGLDDYYNVINQIESGVFEKSTSEKRKYIFSGKYGPNLMQEVNQYANIAAEIAKNEDFDLIHAHDWLTYRAGIAAKRASGKPLVVHIHATEFDRSGENYNDIVYGMEKEGMMAADAVCAVSDLTRNIVINKYGINPDKVVTVHNAVDFSGRENLQVDRGVRDKVVTFLGRITFQKGPEYFIEAAAKVLKRTKNVRFVMAGSGDMMNRAIRQVARLGISDRFHFTGFLRGQEVQKMFALSDVYIMPSVSEPFGISPLEAMRSNVPSILSHQSGAAEVLKYALKVDFWDVDAMADDIYALLQYPALSDFANRQGFDEVNALKWNNATLKLKKVYESVVNS